LPDCGERGVEAHEGEVDASAEPEAADEAAELVGAGVEPQRCGGAHAGECHVAGDRAAVAELERAGTDRRAAGNAVGSSQDSGAGADLVECAAAADCGREDENVGAVDRKRAVIGDGAGDRSRGAAIAELQGAARDHGAAGVIARAGQRQRTGPGLEEETAA
jgi:hypothetical protein